MRFGLKRRAIGLEVARAHLVFEIEQLVVDRGEVEQRSFGQSTIDAVHLHALQHRRTRLDPDGRFAVADLDAATRVVQVDVPVG